MEIRPTSVHGVPKLVWCGALLATLASPLVTPAVSAQETATWHASPIEETRPLFPPFFTADEFAERRDRIYDAIGPGALAVVQGAPSPMGFIRFRQSNELYYLTGIQSPHAYLLLDGATREATLYLMQRNERREYGEGKVLSYEDGGLIHTHTGIARVYPIGELREHLRARRGTSVVYTPAGPAEGLSTTRSMASRAIADHAEDPMDDRPARHERFVENLRADLAGSEVRDLNPILDRMRMVKSDAEIELIRASSRLHGLAIMEAMRATEPGVTEAEMEAVARYVFWRHGVQGDAYYALSHIGANAYMNHYHAGVRASKNGDMILLDYGADYHYYVSDMARMWPANGRFNPVQRELYGFYLAFYEAILNRIRPHVTAQQIKQEALTEIDQVLASWRFSQPTYERAARDFVEAFRRGAQDPDTRLGHSVGLAAHDPFPHSGPLLPGMVFVIEPQFRVPEENIYVRLEDTILLTENGTEILTDFVPRDIDRVEQLVGQGGMLQQYPRLIRDNGEFLEAAQRLISQVGDR